MYYNLINSMSRGNQGTNFLTNLVAYYSFDGSNATDIHTGTHNGTVVGSPTFPSGKNGNCIDFGNNSNFYYVNVADSTDFSFTNGTTDVPFAISTWIWIDSTSGNGNWLLNKRGHTSGTDEWQLIYYGNKIQVYKFQYNNNSIFQRIASTVTPISFGAWHHIFYTDDGTGSVGSGQLYLDGVLNVNINSNSGGAYTRMNNGTAVVRMGLNSWSTDASFKHRGKQDEVAIWKNVNFGAVQATELYNAGAGKFYNTF